MKPTEYIQLELKKLSLNSNANFTGSNEELKNEIYHLVTTKKFRKYALADHYKIHIQKAISLCIDKNQPIKFCYLGGAYKLWRLDEAPESDWAELFALMYFAKWVKPICDIYNPGVWFDFMLDDLIVPRMNNIEESEVETYLASREKLLNFIKEYFPDNLSMTNTGVGSLFSSRQEYEDLLEKNIQELSNKLPGGLPKVDEHEARIIELNTRTTPEQIADPKWKEKVELVYNAYSMTKGSTEYSTTADKIRVFPQPIHKGNVIAVGTTKDSIAKFYIGVGALKPRESSFRQLVLTPNQINQYHWDWQDINIPNLIGKNFNKIRIIG